jgi:hypothetical protein
MIKIKSAEPYLWKLASELPYKESKFSTIIRDFTPSYKRNKNRFVLAPRGGFEPPTHGLTVRRSTD